MGRFHKYELPGEDLVLKGIEDLNRGEKTIESLLVCIAQPRLQACGLQFVPLKLDDYPEMHLYKLLAEKDPEQAHAQMNAYVRRLLSFENALEKIVTRNK